MKIHITCLFEILSLNLKKATNIHLLQNYLALFFPNAVIYILTKRINTYSDIDLKTN